MRLIGPAFAFITTVRAACDTVLWQPKSGDTVQEAADALHIDIDTFKQWNPTLENVDDIHTKQTFTVSYTSALDGAVWLTTGCSRFLHLEGTPPSGHETSFASLTSPSGASPTGTERTISTTLARSSTPRSSQPSPRQSDDSSPPSSATATATTTTTSTTSTTSTTTTSLADRSSKDASPTPGPVCDRSRDGPPLLCNPENDGTFFINQDNMKKVSVKFCEKYGGTFLPAGDVVAERMDDPDKSVTQYEVMAFVGPDAGGTYNLRIPTGEDCTEPVQENHFGCCNGGAGGATELNGIVMRSHPLHKGEPPRDAYKMIES